jgi:RNA polymerase sigma factor (sigma-70 family)
MTHTSDPGVEKFFDENLNELSRLAMVLTLNVHAAEDLVQQTALKVQVKWHLVAQARNPSAYARRLLINEFLSDRRGRSQETLARRVISLTPVAQDDLTAQIERRDVVSALLLQLPAKQRAAIALRYLEDRPDREIASILNCREATVRSLVRRGLDTLKQKSAMSNQARVEDRG